MPLWGGRVPVEILDPVVRPLSLLDMPVGPWRRVRDLGGVPKDQFEFLSEEKHLNWYASSDEASRGYCNRCGTTLLFRSSRCDDEIHVTLANFEQPIDRAPLSHVFYDSHMKWVQLGDDLERYLETP